MDKEVLVMNINIKSYYDSPEAVNIRLSSDKARNREVDIAISNNRHITDESVKLEKEKIQQAATMDVHEVRDFLFMLIGAEVKVKPENDNSGMLVNRLA